jgi:hypothetical protein
VFHGAPFSRAIGKSLQTISGTCLSYMCTPVFEVGREVRAPAPVPVRHLGLEICWPPSRVRQTVRICAESDPSQPKRKQLRSDSPQRRRYNEPDYSVGAQLNIPIRNRIARADVVRDELQYRQSEVRVQQLHSEVRLQVGNAFIALQQTRESYKGRRRSTHAARTGARCGALQISSRSRHCL